MPSRPIKERSSETCSRTLRREKALKAGSSRTASARVSAVVLNAAKVISWRPFSVPPNRFIWLYEPRLHRISKDDPCRGGLGLALYTTRAVERPLVSPAAILRFRESMYE